MPIPHGVVSGRVPTRATSVPTSLKNGRVVYDFYQMRQRGKSVKKRNSLREQAVRGSGRVGGDVPALVRSRRPALWYSQNRASRPNVGQKQSGGIRSPESGINRVKGSQHGPALVPALRNMARVDKRVGLPGIQGLRVRQEKPDRGVIPGMVWRRGSSQSRPPGSHGPWDVMRGVNSSGLAPALLNCPPVPFNLPIAGPGLPTRKLGMFVTI